MAMERRIKTAITSNGLEVEAGFHEGNRGSLDRPASLFINLLEDYRDFLRVRGISEWPKEHSHTRRLRELNRQPNAGYDTFKKGIEHPDPAIAANVMIGLIKLTNYLLDQQLRRLEQDFLKEGGLRERMTRARLAARARQKSSCGPFDALVRALEEKVKVLAVRKV
jgi:four helix bundle suffix protein